MSTKYYMTQSDGLKVIDLGNGYAKSILLEQYPEESWTWYSGRETDKDTTLYDRVAFLYRALQLDANAVSTMPYQLLNKAGDVIDDSTDWKNKVKYLPNLKRTVALIRMSLFLYGRAYLLLERNLAGVVRGMRYIIPTSIEPDIKATPATEADPRPAGIIGWKRTEDSGTRYLPPESVVYFWLPDPRVEIGPPQVWPYKAACTAAGLLYAQDNFVIEFMKRGGVPITILAMKGLPSDAEKQRIEKYWDKLLRGAFDVVAKIFNAEVVEPKQIGQGVGELEGSALTEEKRQDIAAAAGMPLSLLLANSANYATALTEYRAWYDNTITPACEFICEVLNEQIFAKDAYHLQPMPETLDIYQQDESERAQAFSTYAAHMPASIAAQVVGIELPAGVEYEDLDGEEPEEPETPEPEGEQPEGETPAPEEEDTDEQPPARRALTVGALHDLEIWKRKARKAAKAGEALDFVFTTSEIPAELVADVTDHLRGAKTAEDVTGVFSGAYQWTETIAVEPQTVETNRDDEVKALLTAILAGVEALKYAPEEGANDGRIHEGHTGNS